MTRSTRSSSLDWITVSLYFSFLVIGWLMLYASQEASISENVKFISFDSLIGRHTIWVVLATIIFLFSFLLDWRLWYTFAIPIYGLTIVLLVGVLIFGVQIKGATSWYQLAGFSFQPSELAKFGTCLALANYLSFFDSDIRERRTFVVSVLLLLAPMFLILLQPDAGSAAVFTSFLILFYRNGMSTNYFVIGFALVAVLILSLIYSPFLVLLLVLFVGILILVMRYKQQLYALGAYGLWLILSAILYASNYKKEILIANIVAFIVLLVVHTIRENQKLVIVLFPFMLLATAFSFGSKFAFEHGLEKHQQERINVWLRPDKCDPRGSLYNVLQSQRAIGSGGIQGSGFLKGNMTRLNYVPEQTTDFIFSIIGEEQGFIGVFSVIGMFLLLIFRILIIAERAKNSFIQNYAYGVAGIIFIHFFVNIGMSMGVMPVIGIPLPFISKGGTALVVFSLMLGVLLKMDLARQTR